MTLLLILWCTSLLFVAGISFYALFYKNKESAVLPLPETMSEFIFDVVSILFVLLLQIIGYLRPYMRSIFHLGIHVSQKSQGLVHERLFGKATRQRGKAVSFFLKRIAEHKENSPRILSEQEQY